MQWIPIEELNEMPDEKLRDKKGVKIMLKALRENKIYPLDSVKILEYINL